MASEEKASKATRAIVARMRRWHIFSILLGSQARFRAGPRFSIDNSLANENFLSWCRSNLFEQIVFRLDYGDLSETFACAFGQSSWNGTSRSLAVRYAFNAFFNPFPRSRVRTERGHRLRGCGSIRPLPRGRRIEQTRRNHVADAGGDRQRKRRHGKTQCRASFQSTMRTGQGHQII